MDLVLNDGVRKESIGDEVEVRPVVTAVDELLPGVFFSFLFFSFFLFFQVCLDRLVNTSQDWESTAVSNSQSTTVKKKYFLTKIFQNNAMKFL